jgi:hypothetical protein
VRAACFAERGYEVVIVAVLVSVVGQGTLVRFVARVFDIPMRDPPALACAR